MNDFKLRKLFGSWYQINDWQLWGGLPINNKDIYWHHCSHRFNRVDWRSDKGGWASNNTRCSSCEKEVPAFVKAIWMSLIMGMKCE